MTDSISQEDLTIHQLIPRVMAAIGAVQKNGTGDVPYKFRGIDQVMNALQPALIKHGLFAMPHRFTVLRSERVANGRAHFVQLEADYRLYGPRGDFVPFSALGESVDYSDKATNQAMSMAYKYGMLEAFCIPTEDMQDGDKRAVTVDNGSALPPPEPTVDLWPYIDRQDDSGKVLNKEERKALLEAWKADENPFGPGAVPESKHRDMKALIDSYVGTITASVPAS